MSLRKVAVARLPTAAWLTAIVDSSDDAIVSKTPDGIITSWNRSAERLFGYTAAEAIGRHITLIIPEDRWPEEDHVLAEILRGRSIEHFETIRRAKDGRLVDVSLTVSPVRDDEGQIVGASKIARDITERRRLEDQRNGLLERERQARADAEAMNRAKDQFLATMSHELRTPLNAIYGWARMLANGDLDQEATRRAADAILRNATSQVQLVDDLLDVARVITGKMRFEFHPTDLKAVIEAALDTILPAARTKGIEFQIELDPRAGWIMGAPERLQQVFWNLLSNAVKFTPRGGRVRVVLTRTKGQVDATVSDTGEGIPADAIPFIFERFWQGDSSTGRRHGGLGIGLALVRHFVELHGGTVTARSAGLGHGTQFTVSLPVSTTAMPDAPPMRRASGTDARAVSLRGVKVLLVDDDADGLEMVRVVLINNGVDVRTAASASDAREVLGTWWPDLLLTDIGLPGEDGFSLLQEARALASHTGRHLPAIALTAYGRVEDRLRVLAAGFNQHLPKPVEPVELKLAIANVLGMLF